MQDQNTLYDYDPDAAPENERTITIAHVDDPYDYYGGRGTYGRCLGETNPPHNGWLGNPFRVADYGREECIEKFDDYFLEAVRSNKALCGGLVGLPGTVVACHCRHIKEDEPRCHLDVIREKLLSGEIFTIADRVHDITLPEWQHEAACPPEEML